MSGWSRAGIAAFGFELTDETFALHSLRFRKGDDSPRPAILINLVCQLAWITGSLLGVLAGDAITDVRPFALDYALPAMFIALLLLQVTHWRHVLVALAGACLSLALWAAGLTQWNVIIAALLAATLGAVLETIVKKQSGAQVESEEKP
jgi:predicted branched-subunit amino acid permease